MVSWKKLHTAESLEEYRDDIAEAQYMALSIGSMIDFTSFIILESKGNPDKLEGLRKKYTRPSHIAEYIYKKFKGSEEAMTEFIDAFNAGVED